MVLTVKSTKEITEEWIEFTLAVSKISDENARQWLEKRVRYLRNAFSDNEFRKDKEHIVYREKYHLSKDIVANLSDQEAINVLRPWLTPVIPIRIDKL
ncbi:hypothetical protein PPL_10325 [Heterostelium album PN500]|uniref:Uncharacterized protein n=1 Tax=Heterostelium pallidum (strain ATCC 26659 / Pp 5 / PN500) TaxID=670386 RepID=D3BQ05_HETP5|nr:hypothetical protein PPL_10325 [Heterostelium album PN500]EFA76556.1 hypothetical protein PPL_10325 [Heterostelium album PN500]|eukprot:XP_020428688.1 hypothetical protein PPL_10325 [Heterostelium album PN500]